MYSYSTFDGFYPTRRGWGEKSLTVTHRGCESELTFKLNQRD